MVSREQPFQPARAIDEIADFIADPVEAAHFPLHTLRFRNDRAAGQIGLSGLTDKEWVGHFGRFQPFAGAQPKPLALRYHGHQFRAYNSDIGDGRGFLFAQCRDVRGRLMDFGTKGSGKTPYSRFGDGRLTLKGGVREILATEMLEALGVETSRTLSLIETGEELHRGDEPSPTRSAVMVRLSHGHIRIGSFQRLATLGLKDEIERLTDYALRHYFSEVGGTDAPRRLLALVVERTARLAASYMAAGFVHGVLNSDNINVSGESFDYGPWRFAPNFDPRFTAAYFDHAKLYRYGRQAEAIHWDVAQLAIALATISDTDPLVEALDGFAAAYRAALVERTLWRLGIAPQGAEHDIALLQAMESALIAEQTSIDAFFFDWRGGDLRTDRRTYVSEAYAPFREVIAAYRPTGPLEHPYWSQAEPCAMQIAEVEAIWEPIAMRDDWMPLSRKVAEIRAMGTALA